jgi:hypothetical protein
MFMGNALSDASSLQRMYLERERQAEADRHAETA